VTCSGIYLKNSKNTRNHYIIINTFSSDFSRMKTNLKTKNTS